MTAEAFFAEWVRALDELEIAALLPPAEDADDGIAAWAPPIGLGPIPPELVERARFILAAQRDTITRVEASRTRVGRHLHAVRSADAVPAPAARVLDIAG